MQAKLDEIFKNLGIAEKDVVEKSFLDKLKLWARLLDEVEVGLPRISDVSNAESYFRQAKHEYEQIIANITTLNIASDASQLSQIQNKYNSFKQYFNQLIDLKLKIQAITEDKSDINELYKVLAEAKEQAATIEKQTLDFQRSFKSSLEKQTSNSQRVLATHFKKRLKELKEDDATNPQKWLDKRNWWFVTLLSTITALAILFIFISSKGWIKGYEVQLALIKVAVIAVLYLQYHFAAKNYHICADLVAKYEHLAVISETMTDFTAASFENEELNTVVYTNAAKTLFSEINTGYLKQVSQEPSMIENFINNIPKNG